ncbi:MAG: flagellar biosynthesis protein FlhF [Lachnospiraceae bacterium]|nr:flagellar biosynthesis protein FlhF [Lachnospiraceae bacterium]
MIIKKFQAKTEEEAVSAAKREMGENVVIMSTRSLKKRGFLSFLAKPVMEVTVGMEEESEKSTDNAFSMLARQSVAREGINRGMTPSKHVLYDDEPVREEADKSKKVIEQRLDNLQSLLEKQLTKAPEKDEFAEKEDEDSSVAFLKLIYKTLIDNEVAEKYANELLDEIGKINTQKASVDFILGNIYQKMILKFGQPVTIPLGLERQRVIFFIGPTGVGKTTTIAKIASQLCVNHKKKVVLLTTDTYRIAAAEQLRTYASILDVPFRVIYTEDEMMTSIRDYKDYDYILVDTAGHSQHNADQKDSMAHFLRSVDDTVDKDTYLVVSATTKYRDLLAIADAYSEFTDYKLIFTKLDETTTLGNLFNLCMHTGASMSYVTCGQNVPDDIEVFSPQATVKQLLGGK